MKTIVITASLFMAMSLSTLAQNTSVSGDWDGDGRTEKATVETHFVNDEPSSPDIVKFSKSSIPSINTRGYWVEINNLGDLNGDKRPELGMSVSGEMGTHGSYLIYSLKGGKWVQVISPISIKTDEMEGVPVKKLGNGKLRVTYWDSNNYCTRTKVVTIK